MTVRVYDLGHARAGDKGNTSNISVTAYNDEGWQVLQRELTPERVLAHFRHLTPGPVRRYELPQLRALNWLTELKGSKIGRWPVPEFPVKLSRTPAYAGGPIDRGAPCYGEDNRFILREMLGYSEAEIAALAEEGVI